MEAIITWLGDHFFSFASGGGIVALIAAVFRERRTDREAQWKKEREDRAEDWGRLKERVDRTDAEHDQDRVHIRQLTQEALVTGIALSRAEAQLAARDDRIKWLETQLTIAIKDGRGQRLDAEVDHPKEGSK